VANTITHKRSSTSSDTPSASDLSAGEIAINTADGKLFIKKSDNSIATFSTSPSANQSNIVSILNSNLIVGRDTDNMINFGTDNTIIFKANGADQIKLQDGSIRPITDNDVDLGGSGAEFKDLYIDGTAYLDSANISTITSAPKLTNNYLWMGSDGQIMYWGVNFEVTLTHIHNVGLRLNTDKTLSFRDSEINIGSPADGDLDINANDEIELNSTLIDINGAVDMSSTLNVTGAITGSSTVRSVGNFDVNTNKFTVNATSGNTAIAGTLGVTGDVTASADVSVGDDIKLVSDTSAIQWGANSEIYLEHVHNVGLRLYGQFQSRLEFGFSTNYIDGSTSGTLEIDASDKIELDSTLIDVNGNLDVSGNIELGHTSDTTISRASAGVMAVEGNEVLTSSTGATKGFATAMAIAL
jgi:hypothetical protein